VSRRAASLAAVLVLLAFGAFAQPKPAAPPPTSLHLNPDEVRQQLSSHEELVDVNNETTVARYLQALEAASSPDDQGQLVQELTDYLVQRGLTPSPDAAEGLLDLALKAMREGRSEDFKRLAGYAQSFAPGHPAIHLALATEARGRQGTLSVTFLFESLAALLSAFADPTWRPVALANLAIWSRVASFLLLGVVAVLLFLRYNTLLRHDVQEWLGSTEARWTRAAGWIALFMPSLLFLSGYWWVIYWAAVFLLYARWPERTAVLLGVAGLAASGWFALASEQGLYVAQSQPQWSNLRCYANRMDTGPDRSLEEEAAGDANLRTLYRTVLANRYLLQGSYIRAEKIYLDVDRESGGSAPARNNLGCLYYFQGRFQEAIAQFTKATELRGDMAEPLFNRSLSKNKLFDFTGAEADQAQARILNPALFDRLGQIQSEDWVPLAVYPPLEKTRAVGLAQATRRSTGLSGPLSTPVTAASGLLKPSFGAPALILAAVCMGLALVKKRAFFARACFKCGRPYCPRCKTSLDFESFCGQCVHLYIKQDGVSPEARLKKNYEVESHNRAQSIARTILALVAPGAGHVWEGHPIQGIFILALWCSLLAGFLLHLWAYAFPAPAAAGTLAPAYSLVASSLMALVWVVFGLLKALSRPATLRADTRGKR